MSCSVSKKMKRFDMFKTCPCGLLRRVEQASLLVPLLHPSSFNIQNSPFIIYRKRIATEKAKGNVEYGNSLKHPIPHPKWAL